MPGNDPPLIFQRNACLSFSNSPSTETTRKTQKGIPLYALLAIASISGIKLVRKVAAQDIGLSEMENTHGVVMLKSSGAVARQ
jgi:hypothetical protein